MATNDNNVSNCSQVTETHLAAVTGVLLVNGLTSLAAGDFAGLSRITRLTLDGSGIETLPAGLFDGLGSLNQLIVRVGLTHLSKDIFRGLGDTLTVLNLSENRLAAGGLPDGIFEPLTKLINHSPRRQPGLRQLPARGGRRAGRDALGRADRDPRRAGDRRRALGVERDLFVGPDGRRRHVGEHGDAVGDRCREDGLHRAGAGGGQGRQAEAYGRRAR